MCSEQNCVEVYQKSYKLVKASWRCEQSNVVASPSGPVFAHPCTFGMMVHQDQSRLSLNVKVYFQKGEKFTGGKHFGYAGKLSAVHIECDAGLCGFAPIGYACGVNGPLKPNSITLAGSKLVRSWSQTGSKLVGDQLRTSFEPSSVMEFGFYEAMHCMLKGRPEFETVTTYQKRHWCCTLWTATHIDRFW